MILLIRFVLVSLIIYLIIRAFSRYNEDGNESGPELRQDKNNPQGRKRISRETGEYVDYEEVDK
jgi:hypothetical protein